MKKLFSLLLLALFLTSSAPKPDLETTPTILCQSSNYLIVENNGNYSVTSYGKKKRYITNASNQVPQEVQRALRNCNSEND